MKVYFKKINSYRKTDDIIKAARHLLEMVIRNEQIKLGKEVPVKVHFGEPGNVTFISPENYDGVVDYLEENKIKGSFIETNVLYGGERLKKKTHVELAKRHGFTRLPIIIADGDAGEAYDMIEIGKKHYKKCKIGREFSKFKQIIVISHYKGHMLAGFGGALKQLAMGYAARGGKLDMHSKSRPVLNPIKCSKCRACVDVCPASAIDISKFIQKVDKKKCIGCAACIAVCPTKAMALNWLGAVGKTFYEKLAEYAFAATKDKENIYINFAFNITKECDCMGKEMKPIAPDFGVLASVDPVAVDSACYDLCEKKFRGKYILEYAEEIGLGSKKYELVEI